MTSRNRIPPALEPYLRLPPEASLILLTGTFGCSANWLTARFVGSFLNPNNKRDGEASVILASWMRDMSFWKTEIRRAVGIDITRSIERGQLAFLDLLSNNAVSSLQQIENAITTAVQKLQMSSECDIILVLDSPDTLLATGSTTAQQLNQFLLKLRSLSYVHAAVLSCSADLPLLAAATRSGSVSPLPIEVESASFITQQAHGARFVMSVRELETGAARDVSGVLRVTRSCCSYDEDGVGDEEAEKPIAEMEALYLVQRDGSAKVFARGAGGT